MGTSKLNKQYEHKEPDVMSPQLYIYADAYFYAKGRERTYKWAAIKAGANEASAHTLGHRWSKYKCVQDYWTELQDSYSKVRQRIHIEAIRQLEDFAFNGDSIKGNEDKIALLKWIVQITDKSFDPATSESKESKGDSKPEDESTVDTMKQVWESIKLSANRKVGGEDA